MKKIIKVLRNVGHAATAVVLVACTAQPQRDRLEPDRLEYTRPNMEQIAADLSNEARERQERLRNLLEQQAPVIELPPAAPVYNPLDEAIVDLMVENGELQFILRALAQQAGLNLVIHPNLTGTSYRLSLEFANVSAATVLDQVARIADVHVEVDGNTLVVNPLEERIFQLGFMESSTQNSFSAGGDVLGGGGSSGAGGGSGARTSRQIQGEFTYSGNNMPNSNPYDQLEDMLVTLIGRSGVVSQNNMNRANSIEELSMMSRMTTAIRSDMPAYTLNRITGTLYVRAKPSALKSVTSLISNYEAIMGGQVLIDAQLIEVKLNDAFRFGVDWTSLRENMAIAFSNTSRVVSGVTSEFGDLGQAGRSITISGSDMAGPVANTSINRVGSDVAVAVDMMQLYGDVSVLSNPTLRSKHGQPAIISVGTSSTYISNTRVVTSGGGIGNTFASQEVQTSQVFDGLMIGVVPFIDIDGNISLSVHPVQSKVDPLSLQLVSAGGDTRITLPVVDLKSMVTQLKVRSGDAVILGGLIDQTDARSSVEVPALGRIPILGNLFRQRANEDSVRELVLVLKVTLL
jgi:MSHA type pilus biogenesis protein MshL